MYFRFREYDEKNVNYKLIACVDIDDYDTMFKTLTFMKEHKCDYPIEINTEGIVETLGDAYRVTNISLCVDKNIISEESLVPHFVVDIEEE